MDRFKDCFGALAIGAILVPVAARAAVNTSLILVANPPAVNFATDTAYNSGVLANTWVSYKLGLATDDGTKISAVDASITGPMNQRWNLIDDDGDPGTPPLVTPTPASNNLTTADSHLILPGNPVVAINPIEDNNAPSPFPTAADTSTRDYGVGTLLHGTWAYQASERLSSLNFAYLVVPKGHENEFSIQIRESTSPDQPPPGIVTFDVCSFSCALQVDYNRNHIVEGVDYSIWRANFGSTTKLLADGNANGVIDTADYIIWRDHEGQTVGSGGSLPSTVPEPGIGAMLAFALGAVIQRRRHLPRSI